VEIETSQSSAIERSKLAAGSMVSTIFRLAGFDVERKPGGYPGWKPEPANDIVRKAQAMHLEVLGKTPELVAMHTGWECGVIGEKHPGWRISKRRFRMPLPWSSISDPEARNAGLARRLAG
jgi:dipeptidase D